MERPTIVSGPCVYVAFFATDLTMGKVIRLVTHHRYNHVSLALEEDLGVMYSFARRYLNAPLTGGFVAERPTRFLHTGKDIPMKVCRVPVTPERYDEIRHTISRFSQNREEMIYNSFGALFSLFHLRLEIRDAYTCVEFVASLLGVDRGISIKELEQSLAPYVVYEGGLSGVFSDCPAEADDYFDAQPLPIMAAQLYSHFKRLFQRALDAS